MGTNIYMRGTGTGGTQSALAQIDVPLAGILEGVSWSVFGDMDADQDTINAQLSFGSAYTSANDSRQIISNMSLSASQITAASTIRTDTNGYDPLNLGVSMGERIFMHVDATAALTSTIVAILHFDFDLDRPQARRR